MEKLLNTLREWKISLTIALFHFDICPKHWIKKERAWYADNRWELHCPECYESVQRQMEEAQSQAEQHQAAKDRRKEQFLDALKVLKSHYGR